MEAFLRLQTPTANTAPPDYELAYNKTEIQLEEILG